LRATRRSSLLHACTPPAPISNADASCSGCSTLYPDAPLVDVTSRGPEPWVRFSRFFPHGGIPVPFMPDTTSMSVEGIWQGLKVFEHVDIDRAKFEVRSRKPLSHAAPVKAYLEEAWPD